MLTGVISLCCEPIMWTLCYHESITHRICIDIDTLKSFSDYHVTVAAYLNFSTCLSSTYCGKKEPKQFFSPCRIPQDAGKVLDDTLISYLLLVSRGNCKMFLFHHFFKGITFEHFMITNPMLSIKIRKFVKKKNQ